MKISRLARAKALLLLPAVAALLLGTGHVSHAEPPGGDVRPEVYEALRVQPEVDVEIALQEVPSALRQQVDLAAMRREVAAFQDEVLAAVSGPGFVLKHRYSIIPGLSARVTAACVQRLALQPTIEAVYLPPTEHATLADSVAMVGADRVHTAGVTGAGIYVAVLDTGIDGTHPELAGDVSAEECWLDAGCPGAVGHPGGAGLAADGNGHGTHVSGIITSSGAAPAPKGVAPGAKILAFKVLANNGSSGGQITLALDHVANAHVPPVRVVNMSIGDDLSHDPCPDLDINRTRAIERLRGLDVLTFVSSGNGSHKDGLSFSACIPAAVSVGAVYDGSAPHEDCDASLAGKARDWVPGWSQSDDGPGQLDLLAPGSCIDSTFPGNASRGMDGTSMAAPHAAGCAALLLQKYPSLTATSVEWRLKATGPGVRDPGNGVFTPRIDCFQAVLGSVGGIVEPFTQASDSAATGAGGSWLSAGAVAAIAGAGAMALTLVAAGSWHVRRRRLPR